MYILRIWLAEQPTRGRATGWAAALNDAAVAAALHAALHAVHRDPAAPWTVAKLAAAFVCNATGHIRGHADTYHEPAHPAC